MVVVLTVIQIYRSAHWLIPKVLFFNFVQLKKYHLSWTRLQKYPKRFAEIEVSSHQVDRAVAEHSP